MSEHLPQHEKPTQHKHEAAENFRDNQEAPPPTRHEKKQTAAEVEKVGELRRQAERIASSSKDYEKEEAPDSTTSHRLPGSELKRHMLERTIVKTQKRLSSPERLLSKVIHQPAVDKLSTFGAQTVARPIGLLTGGICALFGTSILLFAAKRYGIPYNWLVVLLLVAGGYIIGCLVELLIRVVRRTKQATE